MKEKRKPSIDHCPESNAGAHNYNNKGYCTWCKFKGPPTPRPDNFPVSDLTESYDYYYDPDWGSDDYWSNEA